MLTIFGLYRPWLPYKQESGKVQLRTIIELEEKSITLWVYDPLSVSPGFFLHTDCEIHPV